MQCYCVLLQYTTVLCVPSDVTLYRYYWYCITAGTKRALTSKMGSDARYSSVHDYAVEGVEQNRQPTAIPAALRTRSAATAPQLFLFK